MKRQDIKTAIDILDQVNVVDEVDNQMIHSVVHTLEQCGNEIATLRKQRDELLAKLERIKSLSTSPATHFYRC